MERRKERESTREEKLKMKENKTPIIETIMENVEDNVRPI